MEALACQRRPAHNIVALVLFQTFCSCHQLIHPSSTGATKDVMFKDAKRFVPVLLRFWLGNFGESFTRALFFYISLSHFLSIPTHLSTTPLRCDHTYTTCLDSSVQLRGWFPPQSRVQQLVLPFKISPAFQRSHNREATQRKAESRSTQSEKL